MSALLLLTLLASDAQALSPFAMALAEGDRHYARRAEAARGPVALPAEADAALSAYRRALLLDPASLEARTKLLKTLFFRGSFCDAPPGVQLAVFEEAKRVSNDGIKRIEAPLGRPRAHAARVAALNGREDVAPIYFWAAVSWGQWALHKGKIAAAWEGAAGKIRDFLQIAIALNGELEQGSPYLILGRLHDQCPKIPMLTPWVSRAEALRNLRRAYAIGPDNSVSRYFLADAILRHDPAHADEAVRLLRECASALPRPEFQVEDAHYAEMARERLAGVS